ncbi:hypothetical protein [Fibrella forsythiae]|uniref:Uncharacterized protein n=1 Tax=Fibrella forsythiae TaxID=2817061 RepID=A0ABS3JC32_9BACT|nr:hypothetical protein [Fibrella forsythiae]MBO0947011.1 hypothetical protein [Fibrella forsythiae]
MKITNTLIGVAIVLMLAIGAGLWMTRRKDEPITAGVLRNIAPEATLTTSSTHPGFLKSNAILDAAIPTGYTWGITGGWNDGTQGVFPDWIELTWPVSMAISNVTITSVASGADGSSSLGTSGESLYCLRDFSIMGWVNGGWQTVVNVAGNTKGVTTHAFNVLVTSKLRVTVTDSPLHDWSRIAQIQVTGREA